MVLGLYNKSDIERPRKPSFARLYIMKLENNQRQNWESMLGREGLIRILSIVITRPRL